VGDFQILANERKYAPTSKLYCKKTNTDIVVHSMKYDLRKISFNLTSTTFTVHTARIESGEWIFLIEKEKLE